MTENKTKSFIGTVTSSSCELFTNGQSCLEQPVSCRHDLVIFYALAGNNKVKQNEHKLNTMQIRFYTTTLYVSSTELPDKGGGAPQCRENCADEQRVQRTRVQADLRSLH